MTTLTARGVVTGAAMLQLIAAHAGMTERDFNTGAYLDKLDPALDITARDIITGAYVDKLNAAEPNPAGLMLVPTGAIESLDGDYQRFVYDGVNTTDVVFEGTTYQFPIWYADLPLANRQSEYQISLKMPTLAESQNSDLLIGNIAAADLFDKSGLNYFGLELRGVGRSGNSPAELIVNIASDPEGSQGLTLDPPPAANSTITLSLTTTALDCVWEGGSSSIPLPVGSFTTAPNVLASSRAAPTQFGNVMPLSIKVGDAA